MRIGLNLLAVRARDPVGVERFVRNVIGHLRLPDEAQCRIALRKGVNEHDALGVEFFSRNLRTTVTHWYVGPTVSRVLIEMLLLSVLFYRCDTVLSANNFGPLFGKRSQRRIVVVHDVWFLSDSYDGTKLARILFRLLLKIQLFLSHKIVTVSHFSKCAIENEMEINPNAISVVTNCLDKTEFSFSDADSKTKIDAYFVLIGSDRNNKNVSRACEAFCRYKLETNNQISLVLVGSYSKAFTDRLRAQLPNAAGGSITVSGYVARDVLLELIRNSRGVVFPSLYEGFGIPVIESLSFGKPVLVCRGTASQEFAGPMGVVVDGKDVSDMVRGFKELATFRSPISQGELGQMIRNFYDCQACADELQSTFARHGT